jgi:hypothetical protein
MNFLAFPTDVWYEITRRLSTRWLSAIMCTAKYFRHHAYLITLIKQRKKIIRRTCINKIYRNGSSHLYTDNDHLMITRLYWQIINKYGRLSFHNRATTIKQIRRAKWQSHLEQRAKKTQIICAYNIMLPASV